MQEYSIAKKLVELRTKMGVTQEQVAKALSISNKTVSKWENGTSSPDLSMVVALARYYDVSTDLLLGLTESEMTVGQAIYEDFKGKDRFEVAVSAFEVVRKVICECFYTVDKDPVSHNACKKVVPGPLQSMPKTRVSTGELSGYIVNSNEMNIAVLQLQNESNFSWMQDYENQKRMAAMFKAFSDTDMLAVLAFIHSPLCSESFTAEFVSEHTGLDVAKVKEKLDELVCFTKSTKSLLHRISGDVEVYSFLGDEMITAVLSLVFDRVQAHHMYYMNWTNGKRLVWGNEE